MNAKIPNVASWSQEEQDELDAALRTYPNVKEVSNAERWRMISAWVGSRSKTECASRFVEIRGALKEFQAQAAAAAAKAKSR